MKMKNHKSGSVFLLSIIFSIIVAVTLVSLLKLQINYHNICLKDLHRTAALYNAESGIDLVLHELRHKTPASAGGNRWTGWTINGTTYSITIGGITYAVDITGMAV